MSSSLSVECIFLLQAVQTDHFFLLGLAEDLLHDKGLGAVRHVLAVAGLGTQPGGRGNAALQQLVVRGLKGTQEWRKTVETNNHFCKEDDLR